MLGVGNNYMRRREFITIVGAAAAGWPFAARAQRTGKMYRIGILLLDTPANVARSPRIRAFLQGLQDLGWIDGQNVTLEWRYGEGQSERLAALAADLANIKVDITSRRRQPQPAPQNRQAARSPWLSSTQATPSEQDWCKASLGLVEILLA
jgi:hypothetical protein